MTKRRNLTEPACQYAVSMATSNYVERQLLRQNFGKGSISQLPQVSASKSKSSFAIMKKTFGSPSPPPNLNIYIYIWVLGVDEGNSTCLLYGRDGWSGKMFYYFPKRPRILFLSFRSLQRVLLLGGYSAIIEVSFLVPKKFVTRVFYKSVWMMVLESQLLVEFSAISQLSGKSSSHFSAISKFSSWVRVIFCLSYVLTIFLPAPPFLLFLTLQMTVVYL